MKRLILAASLTLCFASVAFAASPASTTPTFSKDIAPIFYKNCVDCHRPGEAAPMSLLDYKSARPWIKSIREKVSERVMPPWQADPHVGKFSNDRRLQQKDIDTIVSWIDSGAKEGDAKDLPKQPEYPDGWSIGKPDAVFSMPETFNVPAEGVVEYQHWTVPSNFTEDRWVTAAEIKMGNRAVIHHAIVFIYDPKAGPSLPDGLRTNLGRLPQAPRDPSRARVQQKLGALLIGSGPGDQAMFMKPGHGMLIKAGTEFIFQLHYTPNGHATTDRTRVGFRFATEPPKFEDRNVGVLNGRFTIPANEANYMVESAATFTEDATIMSLFPHMHVRGKSFEFRLVTPDGRSQILLEVPKYDFNWQAGYNLAEPLLVPKGSRIECTAYFDNSKGNKFNPDPSKDVTWGDQTWEEMMIGFTTFALPNKHVAAPAEGSGNR